MAKTLRYSVSGQHIELISAPMLVAGTVNEYTASFTFDDSWDGYQRTAVFSCNRCGDILEREQLLTDDACLVPWEVLYPGTYLRVGVSGIKDGSRLPTIWTTRALFVNPGAGPSKESAAPSPTLVEQLMTRMGNLADLDTEDKSSLVAAINEICGTGGGSGVSVTDAAINDDGHLIITLSSGNAIDAGYAVGPTGATGDAGKDGQDGAAGADGKAGADGVTPTIGANGNWYLGDNDTGKPSRGEAGPSGTDGKSAYQYAQDGGYTGTESEFADKLAAEIPAVDSELSATSTNPVQNKVIKSALDAKVSLPKDDTGAVQNGTNGQILQTNGDGTTQWVDKPVGGGGTSSETADIPVTAEKAFAASVLELNHVAYNQYVAQHDSVLFEATEDTTLSVGSDNMIGSPYSANVAALTMATVAYTEIENGYALDYADDYTGLEAFMHQRFGFNANIKSGKTYTLKFYVNAASVGNVYLYLTNDKTLPGTLVGGGNIRTGTVCQITFTADADYTFVRTPIEMLPAEITKITLCEGAVPLEYGTGAESYALLAGEKVWLSGVRNLNCVGIGKFYESPLALTSLNGIPTQNGAINSCATNKVWVNMGDSIWTFGASTGGIGTITDYMLALCGGTWHNIATGGTTMANRPGDYAGMYDALDFWKLADAIVAGDYTDAKAAAAELTSNFANIDSIDWSEVNYITIAYGTNDLAFGAEIDNASNLFDTATICGALRYGIKAINSAYPNIRFKVLGVLYRNADSVSMTKIVECNNALRDAAAYVGAEFIDGYGINEWNRSTYLYDGTHPNGEGKQRIAETLARNIHDIWCS